LVKGPVLGLVLSAAIPDAFASAAPQQIRRLPANRALFVFPRVDGSASSNDTLRDRLDGEYPYDFNDSDAAKGSIGSDFEVHGGARLLGDVERGHDVISLLLDPAASAPFVDDDLAIIDGDVAL